MKNFIMIFTILLIGILVIFGVVYFSQTMKSNSQNSADQNAENENVNVNSVKPKSDLIVTLDDNNTTIKLKTDDIFILKLGDIYDWEISVDKQDIVSPVVGEVSNAQGVYKALASGVTLLAGVGDPKCLKSQPPCGMPSILFKLRIEVE